VWLPDIGIIVELSRQDVVDTEVLLVDRCLVDMLRLDDGIV